MLLIAFSGVQLHAQAISSELDLTAGYSGEEIGAAASQIRLFGEAPARVVFFVEAAWGDRRAGDAPVVGERLSGVDPIGTDVFGAAYPYSGRVVVMEAFAEKYFKPGGALLGVRAGRFRTPFGIYHRTDHGYSGFLRPPLIRYDGYFGLSNNWLEEGVTLTVGMPQLFIKGSVSRPHDVGFAKRRNGTDGSIRLQGYRGAFVAGVSYARSNPYLSPRFAGAARRSPARMFVGRIDPAFRHAASCSRGTRLKACRRPVGTSMDSFIARGWVRLLWPCEANRSSIRPRLRGPGPRTA